MKLSLASGALWAAALFSKLADGVASTDSYMDADAMQSGYLPNHNMDPAVVDSAQFGQLWKVAFNAKEKFYAKPLVFTPQATGVQILFLASSQNIIRTLNAKTGEVLNARTVHTPFLQSDIGCTDIPDTIGIIGTPVIDPTTEIAYFFSKTYIPDLRVPGATGTSNGVYYFHGVDLQTLEDVDGYPILIDGSTADNMPSDYFVGGVILQRPSLVQIGNFIYGGFGGHCDLFNYTGLIVGMDVANKKIASQWATETGPLVPKTDALLTNGAGGEGGVWQSGVGLSSDGNRLFFATGNGNGHENNGVPASGRSGCRTLGEAVINLAVDPETGALTLSDYFQPYDYQNAYGGDLDFGSGGVSLLSSAFSGGGVSKLAIAAGKSGKTYVLNADNLGGYKLGNGGGDGIIQTITTSEPVFGGSGSYPLEGGWLYTTPVGYQTHVYKLGTNDQGLPQFIPAGFSNEKSAGRVGVGIPTVTSLNGAVGTAILWMLDPDAGIRAWYAVPGADGYLKTIKLPQIAGANKFQRPAFGDTRLYTTDANGVLYCLGSPVNLPLNCSAPVDFGNVALGSAGQETVNCTALIDITQISAAETSDANFVVHLADLPRGRIAQGSAFSFPVVWNLTDVQVSNQANASYGNTAPGIKSSPLTITTVNAIAGYSTIFPISLIGTEVSQKAFLQTTPGEVDFGGIILTGAAANQTKPDDGDGDDGDTNARRRDTTASDSPSLNATMSIANMGLSPMTITGYAWTTDELDGNPHWTNSTQNADGSWSIGPGFIAANLPAVNAVFDASESRVVNLEFSAIQGVGTYGAYFSIWSTGGNTNTILEGSASTIAIANMSISTNEGGWVDVTSDLAPVMDFGFVAPGSSQSLQIRLCNSGGSNLEVAKSKPPNGIFLISDPTELHEGLSIPVGECSYGTVIMAPPTERYNEPDVAYENSWTLNTADGNFGVHVVAIQGTVRSKHVGPINSTNNPVYTYYGCFLDNDPNRLLPNQLYTGDNNSNGACQDLAVSGGYIFEGTEYQLECYGGNSPPPASLQIDDAFCNFACTGDSNDTCGGNYQTGAISVFYDATRYTPGQNVTSGPGGLPIEQKVGNYSYAGCYTEGQNGRALDAYAPAAPTNGTTAESCMQGCIGYEYFGMEFGNECYCGNTIDNGAVIETSDNPDINGCGTFCKGNSSEYCGGPSRLNVYQYSGKDPLPAPSQGGGNAGGNNNGGGGGGGAASTSTIENPAFNGNYEYDGCYEDNVNGRALSDKQNPIDASTVTPDTCGKACSGYQYFGVEYGSECYCSNTIGGNSTVAPGGDDTTQNGCSMSCAGNANFTCGGANRLTMYQLSSNSTLTKIVDPITVGDFGIWSYQGCYSEATQGRALSLQQPIPNNSVEACGAASTNFKYFGVEYSGECYAGNTLGAGAALVAGTTPASTGCSMLCQANATEYCGGGNRINLYMQTGEVASGSAASSTITGSASSSLTPVGDTPSASGTTTSSAPTFSPQTLSGGKWTYTGCYTEATNGRALSDLQNPISGTNVTLENCAAACSEYTYFGTEYSSECYCGYKLNTGSVPTSDGCTMSCSGASNELCGGANRLTVFKSNATAPAPPAQPTTVTELTGYKYLGCYSEATNQRALSDLQNAIPGANVSVENCATACGSYTYFGVEYGSECYCGNKINTGSALVQGTGCGMTCSANASELCGAGNQLNMYQASTAAVAGPNARVSPPAASSSGASGLSSTVVPKATQVTSASNSLTGTASNTSKTSVAITLGTTATHVGTSKSASTKPTTTAAKSSSIKSAVSTATQASSTKDISTGNFKTTSVIKSSSGASSASAIVLKTTSVSAVSSQTSTSAKSSTSPGSSSSPAAPSPTVGFTFNSFRYLGCANSTIPLALSGAEFTSSNLTVSACQSLCSSSTNNYGLAGVVNGSTCLCGNALQAYSALGYTGCDSPCAGNSSQYCGSTDRIAVWNYTGTLPATNVKAVGAYQRYGCYKAGALSSGNGFVNQTGMSVEGCVGYCQQGGFKFAGVQNGTSCICAAAMAGNATVTDDKSCGSVCVGNTRELCGGTSAVNVYEFNQTSMKSDGSLVSTNQDNSVVGASKRSEVKLQW